LRSVAAQNCGGKMYWGWGDWAGAAALWDVGIALMTFSALPPIAFCCFLPPAAGPPGAGAAGFPFPVGELFTPFPVFPSKPFWAFREGSGEGIGGGCSQTSPRTSSKAAGSGSDGFSEGPDSPASLSRSEISPLALSAASRFPDLAPTHGQIPGCHSKPAMPYLLQRPRDPSDLLCHK